MNFYNECDPFAAQWLRNLIAEGLIPPGYVDERSIKEVQAHELYGYTQCHFFAGAGGWPIALALAGVAPTVALWTGSCPCQPFSVAGKQAGFDDPRHLWPEFKRLIEKRLPPIVFGEQVAGASDWLGIVRSGLETLDYAVGCMPIEAACAGADHFRDRYWFVADRYFQRAGEGWQQRSGQLSGTGGDTQDHPGAVADHAGGVVVKELSMSHKGASQARERSPDQYRGHGSGVLVNDSSFGWGEGWTESEFRSRGFTAAVASIDGVQYVECSDGKWRRLPPPRVRWLGNGLLARVAKLRAIGNAIDPRPAAAFIQAYIEVTSPAAS